MEYGLVATWLLLYLGLGIVAMPATSLVFSSLPYGGAGFAIPVSFAVVAIVGYWIGHVTFGLVTALASVLVLGAISVVAIRRGVSLSWHRYGETAFVFTVAFLFLVAVRAFKPGVWPGGGEKFLDFGLLASLLRSTYLPPADVWFANERVSYYYGGHMVAALFSMLTDTSAKYAYNPSLAGFYAAYVSTAYTLAGTIVSARDRSYRLAGGVAAFFVAIASNLSTPFRLLIWVLPGEAGARFAKLVGLEVGGLATGPLDFNYWLASRVIDSGQGNHINEFPFFAFLNGDLHAHVMSPVFMLLGVGLAYAYWRTPSARKWRRRALVFGSLPIVAGILVVVNTWSFPTIVGIAWLALLLAPDPPWELLPERLEERIDRFASGDWRREEGSRVAVATGLAVCIAAIGAILVIPFLLGPASGRSIGWLPTPRSDLKGLIVVHGAFLAITAAYLGSNASPRKWWPIGLAWIAVLLGTWLVQATAIALFSPLLIGAWYLVRSRTDVGFESVLIVGVAGLLILVEFVYVVENAGPGRFNTIFKMYAQVWALWSVAVGAMIPTLVSFDVFHPVRRSSIRAWWQQTKATVGRTGPGFMDGKDGRRFARHIGAVLLVFLIVSLSVYAAFSLAWAVETGRDDPTLDSHQYIVDRHPEEAPAIRWINSLEGQPTMVSAPGVDTYQWANGPSSMTGIPTVAGWVHEVGYRDEGVYWNRVRDVEVLFETTEAESRAILLGKYDVEYIYVGPIERERYDVQPYENEPGISVAFEDEAVTIYEVDRSALASTE